MEKNNSVKRTVSLEDNKEIKEQTFQQVFENKFRTYLFKEPYFSEFLKDVKVNIKAVDDVWSEEERNLYTRYFRTFTVKAKSDVIKRHLQGLREVQSHKIVNFIKECYKNGNNTYSDMEIHVDNEVFTAHRLVIACFIPFLFEKLSRTERPHETRKIRITGIPASAFKVILQYIYTGVVQPTEEDFLLVLEATFRLFMHEFAQNWVAIYDEMLGTRTARMLFRYRIARKYGWNDIATQLVKVLALDFENLLISDYFQTLNFDEIIELLKQDEVGVESEVVLYIAVLKWLSFDWNQRQRNAIHLMNEIRFQFMTEEALFAAFNPPILKEVINVNEIKSLIADAINHVLLKKKTQEDFDFPGKQKPRLYRLITKEILHLWTSSDKQRKKQMFKTPGKSAKKVVN